MGHNLLSKTGLQYFWLKLKAAFMPKTADIAYVADDEGSATITNFDPETDTVWNKAQTLSDAQKLQVRTNIGVPTIVHLTDESDMPASPDANTIYMIDKAAS